MAALTATLSTDKAGAWVLNSTENRQFAPTGYAAPNIAGPGTFTETAPNRDRGKWVLYTIFRAVQRDGKVVEGMRVSESTFAIVLEDVKGDFHSLSKANLRSLEKEPGKTYMPSFKDTLSAAQLDDIVAYLSSLRDLPNVRNAQ